MVMHVLISSRNKVSEQILGDGNSPHSDKLYKKGIIINKLSKNNYIIISSIYYIYIIIKTSDERW